MTPKEQIVKGQQLAKGWPGAKSICKCGHSGDGSGSHHSDLMPPIIRGHGPCQIPGCDCGKFRWAHWMPAFGAALER